MNPLGTASILQLAPTYHWVKQNLFHENMRGGDGTTIEAEITLNGKPYIAAFATGVLADRLVDWFVCLEMDQIKYGNDGA